MEKRGERFFFFCYFGKKPRGGGDGRRQSSWKKKFRSRECPSLFLVLPQYNTPNPEDRNALKIENTNNLVYIISLYKSCRTCG